MGFVLFVAAVYIGGVVFDSVKSGFLKWDWPIVLAKLAWDKVAGTSDSED